MSNQTQQVSLLQNKYEYLLAEGGLVRDLIRTALSLSPSQRSSTHRPWRLSLLLQLCFLPLGQTCPVPATQSPLEPQDCNSLLCAREITAGPVEVSIQYPDSFLLEMVPWARLYLCDNFKFSAFCASIPQPSPLPSPDSPTCWPSEANFQKNNVFFSYPSLHVPLLTPQTICPWPRRLPWYQCLRTLLLILARVQQRPVSTFCLANAPMF